MTDTERAQLALHVAFLGVAAATLLLRPTDSPVGPWVLALVLGYHVATVAIAQVRGHDRWLRLWWFGTVLSVLLVFADAVLVSGLGTVAFPDDGLLSLGPVSAPMVGMWTIAVVVIVAVADGVTQRRNETAGWWAAVATSAVVFIVAEAALTRVPVWLAVDVTTVAGVAVYIVPAQVLLGVLVLAGARWTREAGSLRVIPVAALVMLAYTGAAAISWLVVERGILG